MGLDDLDWQPEPPAEDADSEGTWWFRCRGTGRCYVLELTFDEDEAQAMVEFEVFGLEQRCTLKQFSELVETQYEYFGPVTDVVIERFRAELEKVMGA